MNIEFDASPYLIVIACVLAVALVSLLVRMLVLPLFGIRWSRARIRFPWRFSLRALMVLVLLAGCTFAFLRDLPAAAATGFALVLLGWLTAVRFLGFRQELAERRNQELATAIDERKKQSVETEQS